VVTATSKPTRLELDFNGNAAQEAFVRDRNQETAYIGGVSSGKTVAGLMRLARHIFEWNPGEQLAVVAPTVPMLRNVILPEMRRWGLLGQDGIEYRSSANRIDYPNGTRVILESANNARKIQRLEGLNLAAAWLDEVAQHEHRTYRVLGDRLRTGEYRNLFATGTPKGYNWVYDEFADIDVDERRAVADGQLIRNAHTTTIQNVSTRANQANPADFVASRERQHSGQSYQQEVEGAFVKFEGLVYPWFGDEHLVDSAPDEYDEVIYGVDWGHNNPAVILAIVREGEQWTVADEWYERRCTVQDQSRALDALVDDYVPGRVYCDPSEPANIEQLRRDGHTARKAENDVTPGIQHVTSLRDSLRVARHCQNVRNEFNQYQYKDGGNSDDPLKQHDHALDALRYALFTHTPTPDRDPDDTGISYL
jgi:PBSX family phage terminase large subunit